MKVELTSDEMRLAAVAGVNRRINAMERRRRGAHGFDRDHEAWQIDVEGCLAEAAVAKALGLGFDPVVGRLDTAEGDVAAGVQVRSTRYGYDRDNVGCLLMHDSDADSDAFVLVCGSYGRYRLAGWIRGGDGKQPAFHRNHKGRWAYWVEQRFLRPFDPATFLAPPV